MKAPAAIGSRAAAAALSAWFVLPVVPLALWAVAARWPWPSPLPTAWSAAPLAEAVTDGSARAYVASSVVGALAAAVAVPAGWMAATALPALGRRTRRLALALLLAPVVVPPLVVALGINVVLLRLHVPALLGTAVVLAALAVPYTTLVMRSALSGYDDAVEDQARLLGASQRDLLWRIRVPALARPLAAASFLAFLVGWTDYVVTLVVGGGELVTAPLLIAGAAAGSGNDSRVAVLSVLAVLPPLLLLVLLSRDSLRRRSRPASSTWRAAEEVAS